FQCRALVVAQRIRHADQNTDHAILAGCTAHRAVVAVDHHFGDRPLGCPTCDASDTHRQIPELSVQLPTVRPMEQLSFADAAPPRGPTVRETTLVVVDPETTGGRAIATTGQCDAITEIGAVKVRGGVVLAEFATLVDPGRDIPPQIVQLTGITSAMVCDAPKI